MWLTLLSLAAAAGAVQQTDTIIPVGPGMRVQVENFGGETVIRTWDRRAVRVVADHGSRERVEIRRMGTLLSIKTQARNGPGSSDYRITVPVQTDVSVSGVYQDVTVDGVQGSIQVETVNGDVTVRGGQRFVSLRSVDGDVVLSGAKGRINVSTTNQDVRVENSEGDIVAEAVNGDIALLGITSASVSATSVNGDITYDGTIQDAGRYDLNTHNGDVAVSVPENANATVSVATFNGEFESAFPVRLTQTRGSRFTFVLGSGTASLTLESFQGTIQLRRPGQARDRGQNPNRY